MMSKTADEWSEVCRLIGLIAIEAEQLDFVIDDGICGCLPGDQGDPSVEGHIFHAGANLISDRDLNAKINLLEELAGLFVQGEEKRELQKLLRCAHSARRIRNERIHSAWAESPEGVMFARKYRTIKDVAEHGPMGDPKSISPSVLLRDLEKVRAAWRDLSLFLSRHNLSFLARSRSSADTPA